MLDCAINQRIDNQEKIKQLERVEISHKLSAWRVTQTQTDGEHTFKYCNYIRTVLNGFGCCVKNIEQRPETVKASLKTEICLHFIIKLINWK